MLKMTLFILTFIEISNNMSRLEKLKKHLKELTLIKSFQKETSKGSFKDETGKKLTQKEYEEALKNKQILKGKEAKNITCYVVQDDLLLIGDRVTLEAKTGKKLGIIELDARTNAKLEGCVKLINENYKKGTTATAKGEVDAKASAKLGKHVEVSGEVKGEAEATAKAMIDLTRLMAELGVEVKAGIKIDGHIKLDLKIIDIDTYVEGALSLEAMAKVGINWKGVKAEAKASAAASATVGAKVSTHPIKIKGHKFELVFRPKITVYARAEAKATAAAGIQTGVSVGAAAAVGLRGAIEAGIRGDYKTKGVDDFKREEDKDKKSKTVDNVSIKDLGVIGAEIEAELSVGAEFGAMPFELTTEKREGIEYGVGRGTIKVNVPSVLLGPAGVGVGIKVYVSVLYELVDDVIKKIGEIIKKYVIQELQKVLEKVYKEFDREVRALVNNVEDFGLEIVVNLLDFIGQDLLAIDVELKRRDHNILFLNKNYINRRAEESTDQSQLSVLKKELEKEFESYNTYVEKTFKVQKSNIESFIKKATVKVAALSLETESSKIKKIRKKTQEKTEKTIERMQELKNTKLMFEYYLRTNDLALNPDILKQAHNNIQEMEMSLKALEAFLDLVSNS